MYIKNNIYPYFSIYFSSQDPKEATELTDEPLPINKKSNIKLYTSIVYLLHTLHEKSLANLKLINNMIVLPDTLILSMVTCSNWLTTESGSFWFEAAINLLCAVSDSMISVICHHANFNFYVEV